MESISVIVWKLCTFRQQFFHHNFWLKWKFWILMVLSERSSSDLSEYSLFQIKKIIFHLLKSFFRWKIVGFFFAVLFQNIFKVQPFSEFWWLNQKNQNLLDYNQFLFKKGFEVNIKQIFSGNCVYDYAHLLLEDF